MTEEENNLSNAERMHCRLHTFTMAQIAMYSCSWKCPANLFTGFADPDCGRSDNAAVTASATVVTRAANS